MGKNRKFRILSSKLFLLVVLAGIVYVSVKIAREMYRAYQIEQEIAEMDEEIEKLKEERVELNEYLAFLQTKTFKELEYRRQLNKIRPGEEVWILQNVDEDSGESQIDQIEEEEDASSLEKKPFEESAENWKRWWNIFFKED